MNVRHVYWAIGTYQLFTDLVLQYRSPHNPFIARTIAYQPTHSQLEGPWHPVYCPNVARMAPTKKLNRLGVGISFAYQGPSSCHLHGSGACLRLLELFVAASNCSPRIQLTRTGISAATPTLAKNMAVHSQPERPCQSYRAYRLSLWRHYGCPHHAQDLSGCPLLRRGQAVILYP